VRCISGCYYNVVGLPVAKTLEMLEAFEEKYD
jgi:predicted house-cleaning NTP pyrophosphatase (Maf/HAM1 superfamily)